MNYTTQQLTSSLQEITARHADQQSPAREPLPDEVAAGDLVISAEIESFLERSQSYSAQTRTVSVGSY